MQIICAWEHAISQDNVLSWNLLPLDSGCIAAISHQMTLGLALSGVRGLQNAIKTMKSFYASHTMHFAACAKILTGINCWPNFFSMGIDPQNGHHNT